MTAADIAASSPDLSAIATSLTVFFVAIAAVVGGIYKGMKEVKKEGVSDGSGGKAAILVDPSAVRDLSDSTRLLVESNIELRELMRQLVRRTDDMTEALRNHREIIRSQIEEQHRLRAATVDLVDQLRRRT